MLLSFATGVFAQQRISIDGRVVDDKKNVIPSTNIKIVELNQYATTDKDGKFKIPVNHLPNVSLTLEFTFIGYQKLTRLIKIQGDITDLGDIKLRDLNLGLETIDINAQRNYEGSSNSSLIISRDIIEQIPALSLNDLLNQIPNKKVSAPSLQSVQNLTLRSAFSPVQAGFSNIYEQNNAFGVAIIVDGNAISNNMNMQSFNPGTYGSNNTNTTIGVNSYGLSGSPTTKYSGDFAFGGTDLRQIPADNIESIEVISGVPSAKYGDLSDGAVIVERQAGKSPGYLRMQLRDNATSYGYSKGFNLGKKSGALNVGLNYVNSFADNRDKLKAYKRVNFNAMHTSFYGIEKRLKNTFSIDYGRNLDGIKRDTDDPKGKLAKFDSWNLSASNRTSYRVDSKFLKNISLNLRYATGHQESYTEEFYNEPYILVSEATTTGIHEGAYDSGIYTAKSLIDGRPLNISAKLDFNSEFKLDNISHFLSYGASYNYGANNGLGQVLDPDRPRGIAKTSGNAGLSSNESERYYDFNLAVAQQDVGLYIEDVFKANLFNKPLSVRAGLRYDLQNNLPSFSPRINVNYEVNKALRFGLAYGISYKSPALGQRYPGPTFLEVPVINAYSTNGKANESIYLVYVNRYDPTAKDLKSSNSQTFEFSSQLKLRQYNLSLNLFHKNSKNGIGNNRVDNLVILPTYTATFRPDQQPILAQTGTRRVLLSFYKFANNLASNNQGFDLILSTPTYKAIATSFNISGGFFRSQSKTENLTIEGNKNPSPTNPNEAITAFYPAANNVSYVSNGRISSTTHIPKISLFIQLIAEFDLMQKTVNKSQAGIPIAYYDQNYNYITIENFDQNNPNYGFFYKPKSEINANNVPVIVPNFHLSIGKEIKKRFKFSFNVYNVFNYQPYYIDSDLSYRYPNQSPTFGAELSLKL